MKNQRIKKKLIYFAYAIINNGKQTTIYALTGLDHVNFLENNFIKHIFFLISIHQTYVILKHIDLCNPQKSTYDIMLFTFLLRNFSFFKSYIIKGHLG